MKKGIVLQKWKSVSFTLLTFEKPKYKGKLPLVNTWNNQIQTMYFAKAKSRN